MKKKSTIKRVLRYLGKYRIFLILSLGMALVTVAGQLYIPILQGNAIDNIIGEGNVDFAAVMKIIITILITMGVVALFQWIMNICNNKITYSIVHDIRKDAFNKLQRLPVRYADSHPTGEIVSKVIADVDQFADGLLMGFTQFFTGVMTILGTLVFMIMINWKITLVVVLVTPLSFFVASFVAKKTYRMFSLQSETRGEQTGFIDEMIGNEKVVQAYGHEDEALEKFDDINLRLQKWSLKATFFSSITNPATRFVNNVVYALVALSGAVSVVKNPLAFTVGRLSMFLSYANQYTKPFNEISGVVTELQNALACADRVLDLIEEEPLSPDADDVLVVNEGEGHIRLEHVAFSYDKEKELIKDFNLDVKPGERVAIVGPTGCGKTTMINLLMRFYDVDSGSIKVEGKDIRDVTRKSLRSNYGMVLQETWLKSGTIKENIVTGRPDATDEEIIAAAKAAHAHSFIKRLPDGYDTVIGEDGGNLSQGQKQLLCIARVMLCLPPMLILDEATSSIDTRTEMKIQEAFAKMMNGRTSFIVAHRLSTIQSADIILVMKDGNVIEQGNHEELLAKGGFYSRLYNSQFS
ncbi:MAG TPA: ABC transporter ATP-binding protein/permease [Lachnospiraceae bacterium]|nr:ABC transporter ATP-binding protein/permease [Lachnospiraceae bacterium]